MKLKICLVVVLLLLAFRLLYVLALAGLSDVQGLEVASDALSPIVFLRLKNSTGSLKNDLQLLDEIANRVSQ